MNLSEPFVKRPIATVLLTIGIALAGIGAFFVLPVSPLPQVDYPTISVSASLPGASPATMASSVATPLERRLGVISGVNEMTSSSSTGSARINLQFDLNRKIDAAAREVQAAIAASRVDLPATLRSNPTYRKANPSDAPVIILALTSKTRTPGQIYDAVSNLVQQKVAQVKGVGDVELGGGSLPAVRVELLPHQLNQYAVSMEDVRAAIQASNANRPKGAISGDERRLQIYSGASTASGGRSAADYRSLVVAWRDGAAIRLDDVAEVVDGVENNNTLGLFNGDPAVIVLITRQPGANVIATVDGVRALLPQLQAQLPGDIKLQVASDSTNSIRSSLHEIEFTLILSIVLVVLVVSAFLRSVRATIIPAVATIVSLLGTFGVMYMLGFSLNNLSLMALTVATGFVVDDAIVVLENTQRHIEAGMDRFKAALLGAREVGFTVLSISLSLVAVFIPLLFMGGQVGRLFREFAVTLSAAVMISLVISLTTTPMMCAWLLKSGEQHKKPGAIARWFERGFDKLLKGYEHCLDWALSSAALVMTILVFVVGLNVYLFAAAPKGFFPQQDTGQINGGMRADQSISFQAMQGKLRQLVDIIKADPAVATVVGFTGGGRAGGGFMFIDLKPASQRTDKGQAVIARLRPQLAKVTGISLFLNPVQDLRMGGRSSNSTYQYTLISDNQADLKKWAAKLADQMKSQPALIDVDTDQAENGVETYVSIDKDRATELGVQVRDIDNALYNSFGQRQVATIYDELNQYHVIMEVAPRYAQSPEALRSVYVPASNAAATPATDHHFRRHLGGDRHHLEHHGRARSVERHGAVDHLGDHGAAVVVQQLCRKLDGHLDQPPGRRIGHHRVVQPGRRLYARRRPGGRGAGRVRDRHAGQCARQLPGFGQERPGQQQGAAAVDPGGHRGDLYRAGHPVRKPDPSDHGAVDPAVGRRRRGAGAADVPHGVFHHRPDRRVFIDRHRQEKCYIDHRLRTGGRAFARA